MREDTPPPLRIAWASAEVHGGRLTVPLEGKAAKGLAKRFDSVRALIEPKAGGWGEIELRKGTIEASAVRPGAEQELRHLLDSVITQINSDLGQSIDGGASEQAGATSEDAQEAADVQMSERFRAFAQDTEQRADERTSDG